MEQMEQMAQQDGVRETKRIVWGVFLIALGTLFLVGHLGIFGWAGLAAWWPLILVAIGVVRVFERRHGSALTLFLLGGWFMACESGWWGLRYDNSWGLVLVAVGAGIVVRALTGESRECGRRVGGGL